MFTTWLESILLRDLATLRRELEAYADERDLWRTAPGVPNSSGTLALHLAGNLQHYLGAVLGGSGYRRDRPAEFARRDVPRAELLAGLDAAEAAVRTTLGSGRAIDLEAPFPEAVGGFQVGTGDFLLHLAAHFAYHLGQVDYHRRLLAGPGADARAVGIGALATARRTT